MSLKRGSATDSVAAPRSACMRLGLNSRCGFLSFVIRGTRVLRFRFDRFAFSIALSGYFDTSRLCLFAFWQGHAQHAVTILGGGPISGNGLRQGERTSERTIGPLNAMVIIGIFLFLKATLAPKSDDVVLDCQIKILSVHPR